MVDISSAQNDRVKLVRALQTQNKARRREGKIIVEGVRLLADALACGMIPDFVFYLGDQVTLDRPAYRLFRQLGDMAVPLLEVTPEIMQDVSDVETSPGLLAVLPQPDLPVPDQPDLVLVLDGMNTPGNLGSALRTGAAAGVDLVVLPPGTVDPYNPKVLRGGMGAHFRLPVLQMDWPAIALAYGHLHTYLAAAGGAMPYYRVDWLRPSMLIIGSEARGASDDAHAVSGTTISIPMASATESLNAAVAAGVILYEIRRQRILSAQNGGDS